MCIFTFHTKDMQLEYSINLFPKLGSSFKKSIMYLIDYFVSTKVYCSISVKKSYIVPCLKHVILLFQRYFPSYRWETVKPFEWHDKKYVHVFLSPLKMMLHVLSICINISTMLIPLPLESTRLSIYTLVLSMH